MTLFVDKDTFKASDPFLLDRVPHKLACYYQAFPLAEEDGLVTVITAHPENKAGLWVLRRLLNADIVPVSSSEAAVQDAIARIYSSEQPGPQTILAWAGSSAQVRHVCRAAEMFGQVLNQPVTYIEGDLPIGEHLRLYSNEEHSLLVAGTVDAMTRYRLLRCSPTALLLVRGEPSPIKKMLVVLRGYGSDHQTIERALPLLAHEGAEVTVLPLLNLARWQTNCPDSSAPYRTHLELCLSDLNKANVQVSLRLRQGNPVEQIVTELAQGDYDLLVIAAEARGDFVLNVLSRIDAAGVLPTQPMLIIKPPVEPTAAQD
jgi:nucleotide-binding universal stress UspA family protein